MSSLKKLYDKLEKPILYIAMGFFLLFQLLSLFLPAMADKEEFRNGVLIFLSVIIIFHFIFIDRRIPVKGKPEGFDHFPDIKKAIDYLSSENINVRNIDIFAHSASSFYTLLEPIFDQYTNVRVVMKNPKSPVFIDHLKNQDSRDSERIQINASFKLWEQAIIDGQVKNGELFFYDFEPSFLLVIINKEMALMTLLEAIQTSWGYNVKDSIVINDKSDPGSYLLNDLIAWFNSLINEGRCVKQQLRDSASG